MEIEYLAWTRPDADQHAVKAEIEERLAAIAAQDPWLREYPPEASWNIFFPGSSVSVDHELCTTLARAHEDAAAGTRLAGPARTHGLAAAAEVSVLTAAGIPAVVYGPGDLRIAHAVDERVRVDELVTACRAYALLALRWCGEVF
jgi:acetylornithine deacetylase